MMLHCVAMTCVTQFCAFCVQSAIILLRIALWTARTLFAVSSWEQWLLSSLHVFPAYSLCNKSIKVSATTMFEQLCE